VDGEQSEVGQTADLAGFRALGHIAHPDSVSPSFAVLPAVEEGHVLPAVALPEPCAFALEGEVGRLGEAQFVAHRSAVLVQVPVLDLCTTLAKDIYLQRCLIVFLYFHG
jgi:hypothetical protein